MKISHILPPMLLVHADTLRGESQTVIRPDSVIVRSGTLELSALIWRPEGHGPFPAILFSHGSERTPQPEVLGPVFAKHGYVFLALCRRGQGLSADQGDYSGDLLDRERTTNGEDAANRLQVRLLETDQLDDALAGLAFLRSLPRVDSHRVAVVGHSFGGSLTLLLAEHDSTLKAAVDFAGGAVSWQRSSYLRESLISAVRRLTIPVFFIHAANDVSVEPGKVLDAEMARLGKIHRLKLFPAFGQTERDGHSFVYLAVSSWETDVFAFLSEHIKR